MNARAVLELEAIEMIFGGLAVLRGIDLEVGGGEIVAYVGPNGVGKTTTLHIAATLLRPTRGKVSVLGRDTRAEPDGARAAVGYMTEEFGVYDDMRAREYLEFFADAYELSASVASARVSAGLAEADLADLAGRPIGQLSKGQKQRLFFIKTFLHEPALILLDEPFSGMDPLAVGWACRRIVAEAALGRAFVVASHEMEPLLRVATRVVGLKQGRLIADAGDSRDAVYRIRLAGDTARASGWLAERLTGARMRWEDGQILEVRGVEQRELLSALAEAGVVVLALERRPRVIDELFGVPEARR
jgi:ABC-2 type transport system ATP-binding protein